MPELRLFVSIRVNSRFRVFVYFVYFVVHLNIRVHSCPFVVLSLFAYFVSFVVHLNIRVHSCPFVVLGLFRVFRVFRGSEPKAPAKRTLKDSRLLITQLTCAGFL